MALFSDTVVSVRIIAKLNNVIVLLTRRDVSFLLFLVLVFFVVFMLTQRFSPFDPSTGLPKLMVSLGTMRTLGAIFRGMLASQLTQFNDYGFLVVKDLNITIVLVLILETSGGNKITSQRI